MNNRIARYITQIRCMKTDVLRFTVFNDLHVSNLIRYSAETRGHDYIEENVID